MSPTSSSKFFVGRNALSATLRTTLSLSSAQDEPVPSVDNLWHPPRRCQPGTGVSTERSSNRRPAAFLRGRFRAAVRRRTVTALGAVALVAAGCGSGTRQDASEPLGTFKVDVVKASFPAKQRLARQEQL